MTSVSLYGAYEQVDEEHPAPKFGHPKDRRPDLKQIQAGLAVTGEGGIPVSITPMTVARPRSARWWVR